MISPSRRQFLQTTACGFGSLALSAMANPLALQFKGVRTASAARSRGDSPLEALLNGIGLTSRAPNTPVPASWSVQHLFLESRPK